MSRGTASIFDQSVLWYNPGMALPPRVELPADKLSYRQDSFVYWLPRMKGNGTQAAIKAGYPESSAHVVSSQLIRNPKIIKALAVQGKEIEAKSSIDMAWVIDKLVEVVDRSMNAVEVFDKEGNSTGEWSFNGAVANRGLELIGKHFGGFIDRHEISGQDGQPIKITDVRVILPGKPGSGAEVVIDGDYHLKEDRMESSAGQEPDSKVDSIDGNKGPDPEP